MSTPEDLNESIKDLDISVMFCAGPKTLVEFIDNKKDKFFYNIFCFHVPETGHYVVFVKIFKALKRKQKNGFYFSLADSDSKVFESKDQTYEFLRKFLNLVNEHDRFINDEILQLETVNAIEAINSINEWEESMFKYFNELIPDNLKKNKWSLTRLF
jgi:hypothetical protein